MATRRRQSSVQSRRRAVLDQPAAAWRQTRPVSKISGKDKVGAGFGEGSETFQRPAPLCLRVLSILNHLSPPSVPDLICRLGKTNEKRKAGSDNMRKGGRSPAAPLHKQRRIQKKPDPQSSACTFPPSPSDQGHFPESLESPVRHRNEMCSLPFLDAFMLRVSGRH